MLEFKKISLTDKSWVDELLKFSDFRGAEYNFTNLFIWEPVFESKICRFKDFLLLTSGTGENTRYLFPAGKGDYKEVLSVLAEDAKLKRVPFIIIGIPPEMVETVKSIFPENIGVDPVRDSFDYVYESEKLITLSGKKLQPKRNHLARFTELLNWSYEVIDEKNLEECVQFTEGWCIEVGGCEGNKSLSSELCAVGRALTHFFELKLSGGLIRLDGRVVAYSIGEKLNSDTLIIHIEKASASIRGAYQAINREFAQRNAAGLKYINREDDAGDLGLRQAKTSYYPAFMQEKYIAKIF